MFSLPTPHPLPFQVSSQSSSAGTVTLSITAPADWSRLIVDALLVLTALGDALSRQTAAVERARRVTARVKDIRAQHRAIHAAYRVLRGSGLLHRRALVALAADPTFTLLGWSLSEFNWVLRHTAPGPDSGPTQGPILGAAKPNDGRGG